MKNRSGVGTITFTNMPDGYYSYGYGDYNRAYGYRNRAYGYRGSSISNIADADIVYDIIMKQRYKPDDENK